MHVLGLTYPKPVQAILWMDNSLKADLSLHLVFVVTLEDILGWPTLHMPYHYTFNVCIILYYFAQKSLE